MIHLHRLFILVFLLGGYGDIVRRLMNIARELGMLSKDFAFLSYELLINDCSSDLPKTEEAQQECEALEGLLDIR